MPKSQTLSEPRPVAPDAGRRDRAVDENGHQIGVFGRVGARPLNHDEQRKMYLHLGLPYYVNDDPYEVPGMYEDKRPKK